MSWVLELPSEPVIAGPFFSLSAIIPGALGGVYTYFANLTIHNVIPYLRDHSRDESAHDDLNMTYVVAAFLILDATCYWLLFMCLVALAIMFMRRADDVRRTITGKLWRSRAMQVPIVVFPVLWIGLACFTAFQLFHWGKSGVFRGYPDRSEQDNGIVMSERFGALKVIIVMEIIVGGLIYLGVLVHKFL